MATTNQGQQLKDRAKDAANTAMDKASDFAAKAEDRASSIASQAADKASEYASKVGERADSAASSVGAGMKHLADTVRGHMPHSGMLGGAAEHVAAGLESGGRYLEDRKLSGIGDDLSSLIKHHPIPAVMIGIGIGYLIACSTNHRR